MKLEVLANFKSSFIVFTFIVCESFEVNKFHVVFILGVNFKLIEVDFIINLNKFILFCKFSDQFQFKFVLGNLLLDKLLLFKFEVILLFLIVNRCVDLIILFGQPWRSQSINLDRRSFSFVENLRLGQRSVNLDFTFLLLFDTCLPILLFVRTQKWKELIRQPFWRINRTFFRTLLFNRVLRRKVNVTLLHFIKLWRKCSITKVHHLFTFLLWRIFLLRSTESWLLRSQVILLSWKVFHCVIKVEICFDRDYVILVLSLLFNLLFNKGNHLRSFSILILE